MTVRNRAVKGRALTIVAILSALVSAVLPVSAGVATNIHGYGFYEDGSPAYFDHVAVTNTRTGVEWNDTYFGIGHPQVALWQNYYVLTLDEPQNVQVGDVLTFHAVSGNSTSSNISQTTYSKLDLEYNITLSQISPLPSTQAHTLSLNHSSSLSPSPSPSPSAPPSSSPPSIEEHSSRSSYTSPPLSAPTPETISSPLAITPPRPTSVQSGLLPGFEACFALLVSVTLFFILRRKRR
ncbi:MAG: hypothetical protein JW878_00500 [Methanomicrobia archaeon]|nr:hypothetical protein [Methanomicrobia archaeon]